MYLKKEKFRKKVQVFTLSRDEALKIIKNPKFLQGKILDLSSFNFQEIDDFAFSGLNLEIKKLILPNSLLKIGESAFMLNKIEEVVFGPNVEIILDSAFESNIIRNIKIPEKVTTLNSSVFAGNQIENLVIPEWVSQIKSDSFTDNNIQTIKFNSNKINVDIYSFVGNSPKKIDIFGEFSFKNESKLLNFYKVKLDFFKNFDKFENNFKIIVENFEVSQIFLSFNWENLETINLISPRFQTEKELEIFINKSKIDKNLHFEGSGPDFLKKILKIC
ncbi:leucine-rich repeat domain-containing protein [Mesomycoplasma ovipneumoniae]|uniref:leucine-rich repeat domain-containing protein n=1 Tax=Mesomycoplasma ovipneumoniae TaxID=29562 RepID=UPI002FE6EB48